MLALNFSGKCYIMGNYIMGGEGGGLHTLVLHNGGLNVVIHAIFYFNFAENSLIFTTFRNSRAPSPQVGLPFLLLFGGVTPPPLIHPSS
jgi:hypothetical protein